MYTSILSYASVEILLLPKNERHDIDMMTSSRDFLSYPSQGELNQEELPRFKEEPLWYFNLFTLKVFDIDTKYNIQGQ